MADDSERYRDIVSRRRFVELAGVSGIAALAGCSGGGNDTTTGGGGGEGTTEAGTTTQGETTTAAGTSAEMTSEAGTSAEMTSEAGTSAEMTSEAGTSAENGTAAGTSEGGNNSSNGETMMGGGTPVEVKNAQHLTYVNKKPNNLQWNPFNPTGYAQITNQALFDPFAQYNFANSEFIPYGISDWSYNGDSFDLTVRKGLTWSNGDKVTADDIATQLKLGIQSGQGYADYTDSIETKDDRTVRMNFTGDVNKKIAQFQILLSNWVQTPKSVFEKYLESGTATTSSGTQSKGVVGFAWDDPVASGPWELDNVAQQQLTMKRRDDHPDSGNINFTDYVGRYLDGNNAAHQALINNEIDSVFTLFTKPRIVKQFPDNIQQVLTPSLWGFGLVPNHSHKHAGDRAVRQAIQHVINRQQVAKNISTDSKQAPDYPIAIPSDFQKQWLGDQADSYMTYGKSSSQTDEAKKVLTDAGYKKSGGKWKDGDGKKVSLPLTVPSGWGDWNTAAQTVVDQLNSFGFDAVLDGRQFGTLSSNVWPNGDFVITAGGWLAGAPQAYPYFSLRHQMVRNSRGFKYNYPPANKKLMGGSNADVTVPSRTGDGDMKVTPSDQLSKLSTSTDEKQIKKQIRDLAWVTNVDLPMIPVIEKQEQTFITGGDEWDIPEKGADVSVVRWANTWLPRIGRMQYTGG